MPLLPYVIRRVALRYMLRVVDAGYEGRYDIRCYYDDVIDSFATCCWLRYMSMPLR